MEIRCGKQAIGEPRKSLAKGKGLILNGTALAAAGGRFGSVKRKNPTSVRLAQFVNSDPRKCHKPITGHLRDGDYLAEGH